MSKESEFDSLKSYVQQWRAIEGLKPKNEPEFIEGFLKLINNYPDEREVEFDGDGAYFGKQVTLNPFSFYGKAPFDLQFEVAYSKTHISVYSAHHNGFWYPEFLSIEKGKDEYNVIGQFTDFLRGVFGV